MREVSAGPEGYERVRIFGEGAKLDGALRRSPYGAVARSEPM